MKWKARGGADIDGPVFSPVVLLALQSIAHGLQIANVAISAAAHVPLWVAVTVSASCAAVGYFAQQAGNASVPAQHQELEPPQTVDPTRPTNPNSSKTVVAD